MSKLVKNFLMRDYEAKLEGVEDMLVVSIRGIPANENNRLRQELASKDIKITVVRNNLAIKSFEGKSAEALAPVLEGPSALVYGAESVIDVARELVKWAKQIENLELKGAVLDGQLFEGADGVDRLSNFPTREEAQAKVVTLVLSPARKLAGAVTSPASKIASILKTIEEKLEKGEAIAKVG